MKIYHDFFKVPFLACNAESDHSAMEPMKNYGLRCCTNAEKGAMRGVCFRSFGFDKWIIAVYEGHGRLCGFCRKILGGSYDRDKARR